MTSTDHGYAAAVDLGRRMRAFVTSADTRTHIDISIFLREGGFFEIVCNWPGCVHAKDIDTNDLSACLCLHIEHKVDFTQRCVIDPDEPCFVFSKAYGNWGCHLNTFIEQQVKPWTTACRWADRLEIIYPQYVAENTISIHTEHYISNEACLLCQSVPENFVGVNSCICDGTSCQKAVIEFCIFAYALWGLTG